jgi:ATP-dependent helicase HrpA
VHEIEREVRATLDRLLEPRRTSPAATDLRWLVQELRVSLFAPTIRTAQPVSDKRIRRALAALAQSG